MQTTRRRFVTLGLGGALGLTLSRTRSLAASRTGAVPIGFQLYTLRGECARSVPDTLKALGQMGYQGVEFWGYNGTPNVYQQYSAAPLRKLLDEHSLKCCGMHLTLAALSKDNLQRTIENNLTLGSEYLNVAAAKEKMGSAKAIAELAALLNAAAVQCRPHKLVVGYHAHPFDFAMVDGRFAWDILFSQTQPEVNMQMDVGNCLGGNGDPLAMLRKFPGRTRTIHIKEHEAKTFASDYYKEVFRLCETTAGTRWYIVEMGSAGGNGFDVPREALAKLRKIGK